SAYARQFLEQMERPDVDSIEGLSPAISIEQKSAGQNPRSTVGTVTEIYDYLRLLFARVGKVECYRCGREISAQTVQQIVDQLLSLPRETQIHVLAPIAAGRKGEYRRELKELARAGFARVKIDGQIYELGEEITLKKNRPHVIDLVVDRLVMREGMEQRLADSVETASRYGGEVIKVEAFSAGESGKSEEIIFSQKYACVRCGVSYPELTPRLFSFNSPHGACDACGGLGSEADADGDVEDPARRENIHPCKECNGTRLKRESLHVKIGAKSIAEITSMPIKEALKFLTGVHFGRQEKTVAGRILKEISSRLNFMVEVGLDYLTLNRPSATLSGGEAQRIRLATQIGSSLVGVLYILDEPSIGLHQRDHARLLAILRQLRALGNTVLVVEHDRETILAADHVIDMGPGAGVNGGEVVAQGTVQDIMEHELSRTGQYLSGRAEIFLPARRRKGNGKVLILKGARQNNLKGIAVEFPIGVMTCVTGVSGSGKSSLVVDTLWKAMARRLHRSREKAGLFDKLVGWEHFERVVRIDQAPIGRTPRSNPATYTGLFGHVRELFAQLPEARVRGYKSGRFSFNVKGGRCEACQGDGVIRIEMHFLPDIFVTCEVCGGERYNRETLEVLYKGR
ncbi:MAG: ABC-ATPase UvrA, partial [Candidatus Binatota bacterium]